MTEVSILKVETEVPLGVYCHFCSDKTRSVDTSLQDILFRMYCDIILLIFL